MYVELETMHFSSISKVSEKYSFLLCLDAIFRLSTHPGPFATKIMPVLRGFKEMLCFFCTQTPVESLQKIRLEFAKRGEISQKCSRGW